MADFQRQINTPVLFSADDSALTSHVLKIDGVLASTEASFTRTFTETGVYTIRHEGASGCGSCTPVEKTLEIVEGPVTPPAEEKPSTAPIIVGTLILAGLLGYLALRGRK